MRTKVLKTTSVVMVVTLVILMSLPGIAKANTSNGNGIYGNGTEGIYIDINSGAYTYFAGKSYGQYAYGDQGCAWFASARSYELTGKDCVISSGESWYNSRYATYGYTRSTTLSTTQKALACYSGHVSVVEKVDGDNVLISEGGVPSFQNPDGTWTSNISNNNYCAIHWKKRSQVEGSGFLGYVYLGVGFDFSSNFDATIDKGSNSIYTTKETVSFRATPDNYDYYVIKIYRTPEGGDTYLYWEGEVPSNYSRVFTEPGYYSCCFLGNNSVESGWVGWRVIPEYVVSVDKGQEGIYLINENVQFGVSLDVFNYYVIKIYRTPEGGDTYLYWEGEVPSNYSRAFTEPGYYSCCFLGNGSSESGWAGWKVISEYNAFVDKGQDGVYLTNETVQFGVVPVCFDYYVLKIYRTPEGGDTYLYWEGEVPSNYSRAFTEPGYYSCCFLGNNSFESGWAGWRVSDDCALTGKHKLKKTESILATCKRAGNSAYWTCTDCGKHFSDENGKNEIEKDSWIVPATGHSPEVIPAVAPTCTEAGKTEGSKCSICGEILTAPTEVSATGNHRWDEGIVTKASTCTKEGIKTFTCTVCGETRSESIAKTAHSYDTKTTKATLSKNGSIVTKCTECGNVKSSTTILKPVVTLNKTEFTYHGSVQKPSVTVKDSSGKKIATSNYDVTFTNKNSKTVGSYKVTVTFKGSKYSCTKSWTYKITQAANPLKVKVSNKTYKVAALKKNKATFSIGASGNQGTLSFAPNAAAKKAKITVTTKGVVTVPKGCKAGSYIITVTAKGNKNYKEEKKTVTITVKK